MKALTDKEWKILKETGFTPTVYQCDEWSRTLLKDKSVSGFLRACADAGINGSQLMDKLCAEENSCTIDDAAAYILYNYFAEADIDKKTDQELLDFLCGFKYFFGFRKYSVCSIPFVRETLVQLYGHETEFAVDDDDDICIKENY